LSLGDVVEISKDFDVEETGETFEENAILKAKAYGEMGWLYTSRMKASAQASG
jgi:inosine/xanthosine triphosphate pyrophosphatase family protein